MAGTLVAPLWHPGGTLALWRKTELVLAVPCQRCTILLCVVPVCACVLCVPVCCVCLYVCKANGQAAGNNMDGSEPLVLCRQAEAGLGGPSMAETPVVRYRD